MGPDDVPFCRGVLPQMFTKLRPGVRRFLREAAEHFELWIHTNGAANAPLRRSRCAPCSAAPTPATPSPRAGNKAYAAAVTRLLDPDAAYFGGRVIAQGAERPEDMRPDQPKQLEQGLAAREAVSVIVDDTDSVWAAHSHNLVTVEKYGFFPSSRVAAAPARASLMEQNRDDHPESGALACTLSVLMRVHAAVFAALHTPPRHLPSGERVHANWDTRHVLSELRQGVLRGTHLVFSGVIPLGQDPQTHALWQMAARFGGSLSTTVDARATHLVAGRDGTDKVRLARLAGLHVVCPQWLETTCRQWQRADEREFRVLG
jgi:RNA polymerase II C-terminal domain phosphatase-like 3/4